MGKGARNRRLRAEKAAAALERECPLDAETLIRELIELEDLEAFKALVAAKPFVMQENCIAQLDDLRDLEGFGPLMASLADLLLDAQASVVDAWASYEQRHDRQQEQIRVLGDLQGKVEQALVSREFESVIELAEAGLSVAGETGLGLSIAMFEDFRAQALFQGYARDRDIRIERSIEGFQRALALAAGEPALRGQVLMHLGLAFGERIKGDRAENLDAAVWALREAAEALTPEDLPEVRSIRLTNLAWALLRRERGDRESDLREAADLCKEALKYRSLAGQPVDWAHTEINLGDALTQLWQLGFAPRDAAEQAYAAVIDAAEHLPEQWLVGAAHFSLARLERMAAYRSPEEMVRAYEDEGDAGDRVNLELLRSAADHLATAAALVPSEHDPIRHGRILGDLAGDLMTLGRNDEAIEAALEAAKFLTPASDPLACASVGGTLGGLLVDAGRWEEAAHAFDSALKASELSFHSRLDTLARDEEIQRVGNLHRWAAYAFARANRAEEAVIALENGRTRELRRRLGSLPSDQLPADLPDEYRVAYETAVDRLSASPLGPTSAEPARALQEVLAAIRELPGLSNFAAGSTLDDVSAAVQDSWPLIYIDPTPAGTALLLVQNCDGTVAVSVRFVDTTSTAIFWRLSIGSDFVPAAVDHPVSYLFGIGGAGTAEVSPALEALLPWLGQTLMTHVYEALDGSSAEGTTLIPCGPLATTPLHAAYWTTDLGPQRLIDRFDVRYAPSAVVAATAIARAQQRESIEPYLVGLANPTGDLPATVPEVREIAPYFEGRSACAFGDQATLSFLRQNVDAATHLHLSCHGCGGLFQESDTLLLLADGPVSLHQLTELQLETRTTIVSACQTALSNLARAPDEALSIGTAFLAAGSACVFASLWPVDDAATAILMIRVYQELFQGNVSPALALRRAALWLESATWENLNGLLDHHPRLKAEFERRRDVHDAAAESAHPQAAGKPLLNEDSETPFSHPFFWAGFIASGA